MPVAEVPVGMGDCEGWGVRFGICLPRMLAYGLAAPLVAVGPWVGDQWMPFDLCCSWLAAIDAGQLGWWVVGVG